MRRWSDFGCGIPRRASRRLLSLMARRHRSQSAWLLDTSSRVRFISELGSCLSMAAFLGCVLYHRLITVRRIPKAARLCRGAGPSSFFDGWRVLWWRRHRILRGAGIEFLVRSGYRILLGGGGKRRGACALGDSCDFGDRVTREREGYHRINAAENAKCRLSLGTARTHQPTLPRVLDHADLSAMPSTFILSPPSICGCDSRHRRM